MFDFICALVLSVLFCIGLPSVGFCAACQLGPFEPRYKGDIR